jgi:hypothetical protein
MVLIAAEAGLAREVGSVILRRKSYVVSADGDRDFRYRIHCAQPRVVLVDVRFGGQLWRVLESVPAIVEKTSTRPEVVALVPWFHEDVEAEAYRLGCADVVDLSAKAWARDVSCAVDLALAAWKARTPSSRARPSVH